MATLTVYEKPTCSTCRVALGTLSKNGIPYLAVNYYEKPLTAKTLVTLIRKMGIPVHNLLRTTEEIYHSLDLSHKTLSDEALITLMVCHPDLMQRPILELDGKAILGRPVEKIIPWIKSIIPSPLWRTPQHTPLSRFLRRS